MEEDVKRFFNRIIVSVSMVLLWLLFTLGLGIYNKWLIPEKKWEWTNYVFYAIALSTLILVIRKLIHFWREKFPHG
jgi:hypothetical protein